MELRGCIKKKTVCILILVSLFHCVTTSYASQYDLPELFKKVKDSVVVIHTVERGWEKNEKRLTSARGIGSGVIVSEDGLIMTAAHVVQVADALEVHFRDGSYAGATVVSSSPATDLALLKITDLGTKKIDVATIGDSDNLKTGDGLFAIGAPHGVAYTLTSGHVCNLLSTGFAASRGAELEVILTDTGIDVGNSGGPLFNMHGEVVGIVSQFYPFEESKGSMGAAVAINSAQDVLLRNQPFWSGMEIYIIPPHLIDVFNLPKDGTGAMVQRIAKGSPAEKAGLRAGTISAKFGEIHLLVGGDIITEVNNLRITNEADNSKEIFDCLCNSKTVTLTVLRNGKNIKMKLKAAP